MIEQAGPGLDQICMHSTEIYTHNGCNRRRACDVGPPICGISYKSDPGDSRGGGGGARAPIQRLRPLSSQPPREGWAVLCSALASDPLLGSVSPQAPGPAPHPARSSAPSAA